jgi:hypothetical protein
VSLLAELSEAECDNVPFDDLRACKGLAIQRAVRGLAQEEPPEPPADLVDADPAELRNDIMQRYGFQ